MHTGDAHHHCAEDDRCDHHLDQFDEKRSERFERYAPGWIEPANETANDDRDEDLDIKHPVKGLVDGRGGGGLHVSVP